MKDLINKTILAKAAWKLDKSLKKNESINVVRQLRESHHLQREILHAKLHKINKVICASEHYYIWRYFIMETNLEKHKSVFLPLIHFLSLLEGEKTEI